MLYIFLAFLVSGCLVAVEIVRLLRNETNSRTNSTGRFTEVLNNASEVGSHLTSRLSYLFGSGREISGSENVKALCSELEESPIFSTMLFLKWVGGAVLFSFSRY